MNKKGMEKYKTIVDVVGLALMLFTLPVVNAVDLDTEPTAAEKAQFDEILSPVMKIYSLVKYSATAIAAMMLMFAGISYMSSGNDPKKRDTSKSMASFVIIGLVLIWATPALIGFLVG